MKDKMNVLIVDDELHARKLLADYVTKVSFLNLIKTCMNVFEAIEVMQKERIDLLILDIQMPDMTGMEFARSLNQRPIIIFSTAYSEYALESYELDVADYLLKPVEFPRFLQGVYKAKNRHEMKFPSKEAISLQNTEIVHSVDKDNFIIVKDGTKIHKIDYSDLLYIEGQREYVTFHTTQKNITALSVLRNLEESLPSEQFIRVHKSFIVSIKHINTIEGNVAKIGEKIIPIGGSYKESLLSRLNR
ncbi:MAG: LytTR family DNA-binding domain-containing protein [Dysgonamonadaceae bacterium]|jgi:DNA-binding LytR/AlgR family response regulator|nr:LytTR family DNA-binding domain-containing protein [Dysgonamonadaceae bacterium]